MANHISHVALSTRRSGARSVAIAITDDARAMMLRRLLQATALGAFAALAATVLIATPAKALTMQECSAKYKAAQAAGTLGAAKWNDFRKSQCGEGANAAPAAAGAAQPSTQPLAQPPAAARPGVAPVTTQPAPATRVAPASRAAPAPAAPMQPAAVGSAVFPRAIAPKYAAEKPSKQRMGTCLDQYNLNKATNGNGGLKWIQKGGGYYSECNKLLKN